MKKKATPTKQNITTAAAAIVLSVCAFSSAFPAASWDGKEVREGDKIILGEWQTGKKEGKKAALSWEILEISGDQALILSESILEAMPWSVDPENGKWKDSQIRSWLNDVFYLQAFSDKEKDKIFKVRLSNPANEHYDTGEEKDTEDQVFLLSEDEIRKYMSGMEERKAEPSQHAVDQDIYVSEVTDTSFWWLRTAGETDEEDLAAAMCIGPEGSIVQCGYPVARPDFGVRPAIWVKLKK